MSACIALHILYTNSYRMLYRCPQTVNNMYEHTPDPSLDWLFINKEIYAVELLL